MGKTPCCNKEGLNRGAWSAEEDKTLVDFVSAHGEGKWNTIPKLSGLKRCGKSCRLRWLNYLRPDIKRGNISVEEEDLILRLHKLLGNRWSLIAGRLPGRTDNEIKNYWNSNLSKKVKADESNECTPTPPQKKFVRPYVQAKSNVIHTNAVQLNESSSTCLTPLNPNKVVAQPSADHDSSNEYPAVVDDGLSEFPDLSLVDFRIGQLQHFDISEVKLCELLDIGIEEQPLLLISDEPLKSWPVDDGYKYI